MCSCRLPWKTLPRFMPRSQAPGAALAMSTRQACSSGYVRHAQMKREIGDHVVEPGGTFYRFPRSLEQDDEAFAQRAKARNLLIVPGCGFGCPGHVRISYCVPTERIERSLPAFEALAKEYR